MKMPLFRHCKPEIATTASYSCNDGVWIALFIILFLPLTLHAETPVIYSKTVIKIIPKQVQIFKEEGKKEDKNNEKKAGDSKTGDMLPNLKRVTKEFNVEVRPLSFITQHDFISSQPFTDKEGMMMMVDPVQIAELKSSNLFGKIDVLFVSEDGVISKIAPNLTLSELAEPVSSEKPIKAFIFLKNDMARISDIKPNDIIENPIFKSHPIILQ